MTNSVVPMAKVAKRQGQKRQERHLELLARERVWSASARRFHLRSFTKRMTPIDAVELAVASGLKGNELCQWRHWRRLWPWSRSRPRNRPAAELHAHRREREFHTGGRTGRPVAVGGLVAGAAAGGAGRSPPVLPRQGRDRAVDSQGSGPPGACARAPVPERRNRARASRHAAKSGQGLAWSRVRVH